MTSMRHATTKQRNAVFDAVFAELENKWLPKLDWMYRNTVKQHLESVEGRQGVLDIVDVALEAYERAQE